MLTRRLLGGLVIASLTLSAVAPSPVAASTIHDVTFPPYTDITYGHLGGVEFTTGPSCTGTLISGYPHTMAANSNGSWSSVLYGTSSGVWGDATDEGGCRSENNVGTSQTPDDKYQSWRFDPVVGSSYQFEVAYKTDNNTRCWEVVWINSGGGSLGEIGSDQCANRDTVTGGEVQTGTAPSGAIGVKFGFSSYVKLQFIKVEGQSSPAEGGDCTGVGDMAGGAGLTEVDWGFYWSPSVERCLSSTSSTQWVNVVVAVGDAVSVKVEASYCTDGAFRTVTAYYMTSGGLVPIGGMRTDRACAIGDSYPSASANMIDGVYGIAFAIEKWVWASEYRITFYGPGDGGGFSGGGSGDGFGGIGENCTPPDGGWLDLDWFGYIGCVLISGFTSLGQVIGQVVGGILDAVAFLGDIYATALGIITAIVELPAALMGLFLDFVGDLFTVDPSSLAGAWSDVQDEASGKIPFVWMGEVADVVTSVTDAGAMAGDPIGWSMSLLGASVDIDPTMVSDPASGYRPILAGMVWFGLAFALIGQLGGAVGLHRAEGGS